MNCCIDSCRPSHCFVDVQIFDDNSYYSKPFLIFQSVKCAAEVLDPVNKIREIADTLLFLSLLFHRWDITNKGR